MALYLISYDIAQKDAGEYQPLWDLLKEIGAKKILYSEWIVIDVPGKAINIYNRIAPLMNSSDRLLVQELGRNASWDKLLISDEEFKNIVVLNARL